MNSTQKCVKLGIRSLQNMYASRSRMRRCVLEMRGENKAVRCLFEWGGCVCQLPADVACRFLACGSHSDFSATPVENSLG